jgi:hemerythrin-like domain-containing protein
MTATEVLRHEHRVIEMALEAVRRELHVLREAGAFDFPKLEKVMDFGKNFIDRCHHAKEENYLFRKLEEKGRPEDRGLLAELLTEHRQGREHLTAMAQALPQAKAGEQAALKDVAAHLKAYLELLTEHILKEDDILFPLADRLLSREESEALASAFEKYEAEEMGPGVHEKYHSLAHELRGH